MKHFNRKISVFLFGAALLPLASSCALADKDKSILSPAVWSEIDRNRENIN